jgi:hypothetical protein
MKKQRLIKTISVLLAAAMSLSLSVTTAAEEKPAPERETINVVQFDGGDFYTKKDNKAVIELFNKSQDKYTAVWISEGDYKKDGITADIYTEATNGMLSRLNKNGDIELADFSDLAGDDIYKWQFEGAKLYVIAPFYTIETSYANAELAGDKAGWTVADIMRIADENPGVQVLDGMGFGELGNNPAYQAIDEIYNATDFSRYSDHGGRYDFDTPHFRELLTYIKSYSAFEEEVAVPNYDYSESLNEKLQTGKSISDFDYSRSSTFSGDTGSFEKVAFERAVYFGGKDIVLKGSPTMDGQSCHFPNTIFSYKYGMNKNAENTEGARAFMSFILSKEYGETLGSLETSRNVFSINRKANEAAGAALVGTVEEFNGITYKITEDDVSDVLAALENTGYAVGTARPKGLYDAFYEETYKFIRDEQSLDETVLNITERLRPQSKRIVRVVLYADEVNAKTNFSRYTVDLFNAAQDEYEAVVYTPGGLRAEETPDIVVEEGISELFEMAENGELADISGLMDDDIYDWAKTGEVYYFTPHYKLMTAYAYTEFAGDKPGWTVAELIKIAGENEGKPLIYGEGMYNDYIEYLECVLLSGIDISGYQKDGVYNFNRPQFREILQYIKSYRDFDFTARPVSRYDTAVLEENIKEKNALSLFEFTDSSGFGGLTGSFADITKKRIEYFGGEAITAKGFPTVSGAGGSFAHTYSGYDYAQYKNAVNKEGAEAFINYLLSAEYGETASGKGFSINRKANENVAAALIGTEITLSDKETKAEITKEDTEVALAALLNIAENGGEDVNYDRAPLGTVPLQMIIRGETFKYYQGKQTLTETVNNINKLVNENPGKIED